MVSIKAFLFQAMWIGYIGYWWAAARNVKATERREDEPTRILRLLAMLGAIILLGLPSLPLPVVGWRFLQQGPIPFWVGASLTATGLLFSVWARHHLGRNWSQAVTIKEGHELITSGPYALVRHPIYTGLLLALSGTAVALGEYRGLLAVVLVTAVIWQKLRLEEQWLHREFGTTYQAYASRVAALLPFLI